MAKQTYWIPDREATFTGVAAIFLSCPDCDSACQLYSVPAEMERNPTFAISQDIALNTHCIVQCTQCQEYFAIPKAPFG